MDILYHIVNIIWKININKNAILNGELYSDEDKPMDKNGDFFREKSLKGLSNDCNEKFMPY